MNIPKPPKDKSFIRPLEVNWLVTLIIFFTFLVLFGLLIYELQSILTPIWLVLAILFLLAPLRYNIVIRRVMILIGFIAAYFLYQEAKNVITPIVISFVLAYLFDPLIDRFERYKVKRERAILWLILGLSFFMGLAIVFIIPILIEEIQKFFSLIPSMKSAIMGWVVAIQAKLIEYGVITEEKFLDQKLLAGIQNVLEALFSAALTFAKAAGSTISHFLNIILIPFLTYYFLVDFDRIRSGVIAMVPLKQQTKVRETINDGDKMVGLYLRGQLLVCMIIGVLTSMGLGIFGVDYALLLGTMAGIANLVPYVGLTVTLIIGGIISLFGSEPVMTIVKLGGVFWAVQFLEGTFISPRVVGNVTGLHPAVVMISLLLFANFFGFVGLLIAVPVTAVGKALVKEWHARYRRSDFYRNDSEIIHDDGSVKGNEPV